MVGMTGLSDRLAGARAEALVGREPERATLDRMLSGAAGAPIVAYLHGPGGIGKSALLRYAAGQAAIAGRRVVHVDGRYLDNDPHRLAEAAAPAVASADPVLLILDTFEQCRALEPWLRDTFLPRLAPGALVVLASRAAPDVEWALDPGWAPIFAELPVRPLDAAESDALLAARDVPADQRGPVVAFAGGSPLVLSLAAAVTAGGAAWEPTGDILTTLIERLIGDLPGPAHQRALEVVAQAYVTRESLLRAVLGDEEAATVFPWLRGLPYVEATAEGLHPHDAVRSTLAADLRWRDPERYEDVRARTALAGADAVRAATDGDALVRVAEWMYLFRDDCGPDDPYDWRPHPHIEDSPMRSADVPAVLRLAPEPEVAHWVRRRPQDFRVFRSAGSPDPVAVVAFLQLSEASPEDRAADPAVAALWDFVAATAPLAPGEHLSVRRFAVLGAGDQSVLDLIGRRAVAGDLRDTGRAMSFAVVEDADRVRGYFTSAGLQEVAAADVGGRKQHVFGRDWRRQPVARWVEQRARSGAVPAGWADELPPAAFEQAVAEALRTWHAPREFATSALLRSRLVRRGSDEPVADLRGAIMAALDALPVDAAGVKAQETLIATYIAAPRSHKAAALRLGVPYGTYRRRLAVARERLVDQLNRRMSTAEHQ
jgi:DNA-directed RNA polymerase specialized sigma24 family protein